MKKLTKVEVFGFDIEGFKIVFTFSDKKEVSTFLWELKPKLTITEFEKKIKTIAIIK
jgi:hypothetical protein